MDYFSCTNTAISSEIPISCFSENRTCTKISGVAVTIEALLPREKP